MGRDDDEPVDSIPRRRRPRRRHRVPVRRPGRVGAPQIPPRQFLVAVRGPRRRPPDGVRRPGRRRRQFRRRHRLPRPARRAATPGGRPTLPVDDARDRLVARLVDGDTRRPRPRRRTSAGRRPRRRGGRRRRSLGRRVGSTGVTVRRQRLLGGRLGARRRRQQHVGPRVRPHATGVGARRVDALADRGDDRVLRRAVDLPPGGEFPSRRSTDTSPPPATTTPSSPTRASGRRRRHTTPKAGA